MQYVRMNWRRPFDANQVESSLITLAETRPRGMVVMEIIGESGREVKYHLGVEKRFLPRVEQAFKSQGKVTFRDLKGRGLKATPTKARTLKLTRPNLSLNTDIAEGMLRAGLATLSSLPEGNSAVVQLILGAAYPPELSPTDPVDLNASWLDILLGNVRKASAEQQKLVREKTSKYSFDVVLRIGASGKHAESTLNSLTGVFRTMSSAGVRVVSKEANPQDLIDAKIPWRIPMRLTVSEIVMNMLLPTGEEDYPGVGNLHPLELPVPSWYHEPTTGKRSFAVVDSNDASSEQQELSISSKDSLEHTVILGPTGAGKSTVMLNLIMADIETGKSVMVIDPKADLVSDILERVPEERLKDLVVIDPADEMAVGWNPLEMSSTKHPELVADAILAVFKDIFDENWGIRVQDILSAALMTLAGKRDATLMWLPSLLTDETFRKRITRRLTDQIALQPFWEQYDAMKESERRVMVESSLNKVRQIMFRPGLRNVLGQAHPKFKLGDLFTKRKIVLVPLNKGLIGSDSARLLGSLLVGMTWIEILSRADVPKEKRHTVSMYIDELQDYIHLPGSFADSLAQARSLGLAITVAHQYRAQLDNNLKEGIDANCRNKIIFGLSGTDAQSIAHLTTELTPVDFMSLPRYHVYTNFMVNGKATGWVSATTMKAKDPLRLPVDAKLSSELQYGKESSKVEEEIMKALYPHVDLHTSTPLSDQTATLNDLYAGKPDQLVIGIRPDTEGEEPEKGADTHPEKGEDYG